MTKQDHKVGGTSRTKPPRFPTLITGWVEWVAFPKLGIDLLEAKIDTGAKASSLHAEKIEPFEKDGERWVRFVTHPKRKSRKDAITCEAKVIDERRIKSSNGVYQTRYVISTWVHIGPYKWPIDISLTSRKGMEYRMLFGRSALGKICLVSPTFAHLLGEPKLKDAVTIQSKRYILDHTHV